MKVDVQMEQVKRQQVPPQADVLERLMEYLDELQKMKFTGQIKINYTQGSIGRVEKFEEISKILKV